MMLNKEDADLFFKLHWSLLFFVNMESQIIKGLSEPYLKNQNLEEVNELNEILFNNPEIIDSFISENPFNFSSDELIIIKSWKNHIKDRFLIVAHLKKYSVFMTTDNDPKAYGVIGIYEKIEDVVSPLMPQYVKTTLLPFKGKIIYCGLISFFNIRIGSGMKGSIQAEYQQAKSKYGIITSLDESIKEKKESDEELLRYYVRSTKRRMEYEIEILEILDRNPALWNLYSLELGKSFSKQIRKRLEQIDTSTTWFAVFEDLAIASGQNEEEAKDRAHAIVQQDKWEGLYIFRFVRK